jgi:osmoprotectant transport system permease protein
MGALLMGTFWQNLATAAAETPAPVLTIGSKVFTESYILAEIVAQIAEDVGEARVRRKFGLGGTGIAFEALRAGEIDLYPEYTGTISEAILKADAPITQSRIQAAVESMELLLSGPLGFNNTYALAARREVAEERGLIRISDLAAVRDLRVGFSHEFMQRKDGYQPLAKRYGLELPQVRSLAHSLAYEALRRAELDLTDVYSTDAKIEKLGLKVLEDDRKFFPEYLAVLLARSDLRSRFPKTWTTLDETLSGRIDAVTMIRLNAQVDIDQKSFAEVAAGFLGGLPDSKQRSVDEANRAGSALPALAFFGMSPSTLERLTAQHLKLVGISLLFSLLVGVPFGVISARSPWAGQLILGASGVLQTIPSLALLCFLIPFFGIGVLPALIALFLYGLLPIVSGTYTGLVSIDPKLIESSDALGLSSLERLRLIELPLASRSILAGVKTSAIIGIGTATLAAMIGAGGYGSPIVTGLALNNTRMILSGAVPAAVLALVAQGVFFLLGRVLVPRGLRQS